jgi:hypothetical protein
VTHAELVKIAARWLKREKRCSIVATELVCAGSRETPDAIGWAGSGTRCAVVECKISRGDYKRDARKCRDRAGNERYYLTPAGMLAVDEVPSEWGLLEWNGSAVNVVREATWCSGPTQNEVGILYSIILRLNGRSPMPERATLDLQEQL